MRGSMGSEEFAREVSCQVLVLYFVDVIPAVYTEDVLSTRLQHDVTSTELRH